MSLQSFKYNFKNIIKGDSYKGAQLTVTNTTLLVPIDLTGATIKMQLRKNNCDTCGVAIELSTENGLLTITDDVNGVFTINQFTMSVPAGVYSYDMQFTFSGGTVQTYLYGLWTVTEDITS